jgi:hypothetical protein
MFLLGTRLGLHEFPLQIDRDSGRPFSNRRSGWKDYLGRSIRRRLICADRGGSGRQALIEQEQSQKEFSTCQGNRGLAFRLFLLDIRRPLRATAGRAASFSATSAATAHARPRDLIRRRPNQATATPKSARLDGSGTVKTPNSPAVSLLRPSAK